MASTQIDTQKVRDALAQLQDVHGKLQTAMQNAEAAANRIRSAWESSEAAPAFNNDMSKWASMGPQLIQDTKDMIDFLQQGIADYEAAEQKIHGAATGH